MEKEIISWKLREKWTKLNNHKNAYTFNEESIDMAEFAQIIKETFQAIKNFKISLIGEDMRAKDLTIAAQNELKPEDIHDYANLMVEIAKYSVDTYVDECDEHTFQASQIVTRMLLNYAYFYSRVNPTDDNGVLFADCEDCELYPQDNDEFWEKTFSYDTNTGDMSEIMEVVNRYYK